MPRISTEPRDSVGDTGSAWEAVRLQQLGTLTLNDSSLPVSVIDRQILFPLGSFFSSASSRAYTISLAAVGALLLGMTTLMYAMGLAPISVLPWDMAIQLDGAWRILSGQVPNVDFRAIVPPMTLELSALAMRIGSPSASCIAYGNLFLFVFITPWAWIIARARFSAAYAGLFAAFVGFVLLTPRPLGDKIGAISYAMLYNRQGWAILAIVLVSALVPSRSTATCRIALSGFANGVLLALLLFSKLNFFAVGVTAIALRALVDRRGSGAMVIGALAGGLGTFLVLHSLAGLDLAAYVRETLAIAPVYGEGKLADLLEIAAKNLDQLFIVAFLLLLCLKEPVFLTEELQLWGKGSLTLTVGFVCVSAVALTATSAQRIDIPLFAVAGLVCVEWLRRATAMNAMGVDRPGMSYTFAAILLAPLLIGPVLGKDAAALAHATRSHFAQKASLLGAQRFESTALRDFVIPAEPAVVSNIAPSQPAAVYPRQINDGIGLLRRHVTAQSRVVALDFSNPFPFALGLPPARGGSTSWLVGGSFSKTIHPSAPAALGNADLVMIPRYERNALTVTMLREIYATYLSENFRPLDRTELWDLYEKKEAIHQPAQSRPAGG
jgi:hypothetical protein